MSDPRIPWNGQGGGRYLYYPLTPPTPPEWNPASFLRPLPDYVIVVNVEYGESPWSATIARLYAEVDRADKLETEVRVLRAELGKEAQT